MSEKGSILSKANEKIAATKKVAQRILSCTSFKIGKTGLDSKERLSWYQKDKDEEYYTEIEFVYDGSKQNVCDMESYLIDKYLLNPKCDNSKDGARSNKDPMDPDAPIYHVYVVWR